MSDHYKKLDCEIDEAIEKSRRGRLWAEIVICRSALMRDYLNDALRRYERGR